MTAWVEVDPRDAALVSADMEGQVLDLVADATALVRNRAVGYTPHRKGVAAASWRWRVGGVDGSAEQDGTTHARPADISPADVRAKLKRIGQAVNVTNNLWRIGFLEDGTSKNRPAKMAARAVADADARFG